MRLVARTAAVALACAAGCASDGSDGGATPGTAEMVPLYLSAASALHHCVGRHFGRELFGDQPMVPLIMQIQGEKRGQLAASFTCVVEAANCDDARACMSEMGMTSIPTSSCTSGCKGAVATDCEYGVRIDCSMAAGLLWGGDRCVEVEGSPPRCALGTCDANIEYVHACHGTKATTCHDGTLTGVDCSELGQNCVSDAVNYADCSGVALDCSQVAPGMVRNDRVDSEVCRMPEGKEECSNEPGSDPDACADPSHPVACYSGKRFTLDCSHHPGWCCSPSE
ncbi:MAG: hypothetical protein FJ087_20820 [Deltaproteobacteria bacterium]|nr:hypothetical protein [Deltaproteobacteria bacterium]